MKDDETRPESQERDGLDEWVDELDRLIGIEQKSDEEIIAEQAELEGGRRGIDITLIIAAAIIVLLLIAALLLFGIL